MPYKRICCWVVLIVLCQLASAESANSPGTLAEYIAALDHLSASIDEVERNPRQAGTIAGALPDTWTVTVENRTFTVAVAAFRLDIEEHKPASLQRARRRLALMREEAATYDHGNFDFTASRTHVDGILARREFRHVQGPTWFEQVQQRVVEWLLRVLGRIFGSSAVPTVTRVIVWILIAAALGVLAVIIFRAIRRQVRFETILPNMLPVSAKGWSIWMAEAREAAARGNWREAIHLAYWGGISFLEAQGSWRPDRARTPREYLRLLPQSNEHRPALSALTRRFEVVWYGYQSADEHAFSQTLAELENLGCR